MNFKLEVKEINMETFILTGKINDQEIINNLIKFIKNNEKNILNYKTSITGKQTDFKFLNENEYFQKFLSNIKNEIKIINGDKSFVIKDAWGNLINYNEEILEHDHKGTAGFCGILYLTDNGPGTYFKDYDLTIKEEKGRFVLFDPVLKHSVKKLEEKIERISIAFNMVNVRESEKPLINQNTIKL
jgi:hypothetical protein